MECPKIDASELSFSAVNRREVPEEEMRWRFSTSEQTRVKLGENATHKPFSGDAKAAKCLQVAAARRPNGLSFVWIPSTKDLPRIDVKNQSSEKAE
jgi:hypothetical protein